MTTETTLFYIALVGVVLAILGLLWLIVNAFEVRIAWGLAVFIFPPLGLLFALRHRRPATWPVILMAVGALVGAAPIAYNKLVPIDLGPRATIVEGERHITLTGWDQHDYSVLKAQPEVVVLQMANPDVTDETLDELSDLARLRELDLSGTQVGDAGLARLEKLTALESLRLKDTRITEEGFLKWLSNREALKQLDLRGTKVTRESGKAWRTAKPGRRLMQ